MWRLEYKIFALFFGLVLAGPKMAGAQEKETIIQEKIQQKNYVFRVQSVSPPRGNISQLSLEYDLRVSMDSVISYLPYFGRAYIAPISASEGGIKFTSTSFDYKVALRKKGGWDITIRPKDVSDIRQLFLTVFPNGNASLQVMSNNREPISFNGFISDRNKN